MLIQTDTESVSAVNAAAGMQKLLQISGGAVYTDEQQTIKFDVKPRLNALMEVLEETDNKVLLFVPYRHTITFLSEFLDSKNITNEVINGDVSANQRASIINRFSKSRRT